MRNKGSFLLVLIISVIIVGVLVVMILLPRMNNDPLTRKPKVIVARREIATIEIALKRYKTENGFFPTTAQGLDALMKKPTTPPVPQHWAGPYLEKAPNDPWGNPYQYCHPPNHGKDYDIWSKGPDGKDGTDDDIVSWEE